MIPQLILHWAKQTPDKTAVFYNGRAISYRSFAQLIAVARGYFARRGYVGPGYAVLAVSNLMGFWTLSLALRSLGLTTVAVPSVEELGRLGLPDIRCVIASSGETWSGLERACTELGLPLLSVSLAGEPTLGLEALEAPHQYPLGGYVLRTSATTGNYKLVLRSPAIDAAMLRRRVEILAMNQDTVLSVFHIPAWTGAGYWWAASVWTVGGTTIIEPGPPYRALLYPGITHAALIPQLLDAILAAPVGAFPRNDAMQLVVTAGAMTRIQVEQAKVRIAPRLFNWLSSTEADVIACTPLETPEDHRWHRLVPGRVVEIVDESDRPVPTGEIGRLRVGTGGGPTRYLHDEAATRAFFKNGFFYPGDLAVIRSDGRMALQGRLTDVINVLGHKISPAPVEDRLGELFGASGVCLFSMQNDSGEEMIHVVIETPTLIDSKRLIEALNQELRLVLPGNPSILDARVCVHCVAALPRNQMGKVLRQAVRTQVIATRR